MGSLSPLHIKLGKLTPDILVWNAPWNRSPAPPTWPGDMSPHDTFRDSRFYSGPVFSRLVSDNFYEQVACVDMALVRLG